MIVRCCMIFGMEIRLVMMWLMILFVFFCILEKVWSRKVRLMLFVVIVSMQSFGVMLKWQMVKLFSVNIISRLMVLVMKQFVDFFCGFVVLLCLVFLFFFLLKLVSCLGEYLWVDRMVQFIVMNIVMLLIQKEYFIEFGMMFFVAVVVMLNYFVRMFGMVEVRVVFVLIRMVWVVKFCVC